ncbi:MAG: hypothetical protein JXA03_01100, partial [Bacteroidales bacterium]|nr:hypothetical protein [Bacteroidales bacterium]
MKIPFLYKFRYIIISLVLFECAGINAQGPDPYGLMAKAGERLDTIEDYSVNVKIMVYVDYISIPPKDVSLYYKKPGKIRFVS